MIDTAAVATGIEIVIEETATGIAIRGAMARGTRDATDARVVKTAAIRRRAAPTAPSATQVGSGPMGRVRIRHPARTKRRAKIKHSVQIKHSAKTRHRVTTQRRAMTNLPVTTSRRVANPVPQMQGRTASAPVMSAVNAVAEAGGGVAAAVARVEKAPPTAPAKAAARMPARV